MATTGLARTMSKNKVRDARLEALKNASRDYEASPHLEDLERMVLGAARAWAKAGARRRGARRDERDRDMNNNATFADLYDPAMKIEDQDEADIYFAQLLERTEDTSPEAVELHRKNLSYWAGYFDNATRERVERLFRCEHPVFGSIAKNGPPSAERAFAAGVAMAESWKARPRREPKSSAEPGMASLLRHYAGETSRFTDDFTRALFLDAAQVIEDLAAAHDHAMQAWGTNRAAAWREVADWVQHSGEATAAVAGKIRDEAARRAARASPHPTRAS